jgi:Calcium-activated chloride channel
MASTLPYVSGDEPRDTPVYVMQFPNPFCIAEDKKLSEPLEVETARHKFLRIYKTSDNNEEKQIIPQIAEDSQWWLKDGEWWLKDDPSKDYRKTNIPRKDFIKAVVSSVLYTIRYELGMDYSLLLSRDKDEFFCTISVSEKWLRNRAIELDYKLQFQTKPKHTEPFQKVAPYGPASIIKGNEKNLGLFLFYDENGNEVAEKGSLFTYSDKSRIVIDALLKKLDLHAMQNAGVMIQDFCLHQEVPLDELKSTWGKFTAIFRPQPIDKIRKYFSEKVALYFAWIGNYMLFMLIAAIVGLIILSIEEFAVSKDSDWYKVIIAVYAVFLSFWASSFDQYWTREEKVLAWRWGTVNVESQETQRAEFEGEFRMDPVTGKMKVCPNKDNSIKIAISYTCISVFVMMVIIAVIGIFILKHILKGTKAGSIVPAVINSIQIKVFNQIYGIVALKLNDWENHETENAYNDNLALKLFLFKIVNSYAGLFYIAFFKSDCGEEGCVSELGTQILVLFLTNTFMNALELGIPLIKWKLDILKEDKKIKKAIEEHKDDPEKKANYRIDLYPVEKNSKLAAYESPLDDYMEMAIQFGYVALFGASQPLIPVLAFIEILIEIRVDAWKLCKLTRRPDPQRSENIGVWKSIIVTIAYIGSVTNSGIVVFTSGIFDSEANYLKVIIFILLEHFLLIGMYIIAAAVPDTPIVVTDGLTWSNRIVKAKILNQAEDDRPKFEFNTSRGDEPFLIEPKDLNKQES